MITEIESSHPYFSLRAVLGEAWEQAALGKGKDRHQKQDEPFEDQPICMFARRVGIGFPLGQAMKKIDEAAMIEHGAAVNELLGAINYIAAAVIVLRESISDEEKPMILASEHRRINSILGEK